MLPRLSQLPLPLLLLLSAAVTSSATVSPSPAASYELICHTSDPAECYPRLFQPTQDFQIVKEDQDLPPGLHVRLNLETSQKEAKLYDNAPISSSELAVVVDDDGITDSVGVEQAPRPENPTNKQTPPAYNPAGKIPVPKDADERSLFLTSLAALTSSSSDPSTLLTALADLEDLTHDLYYGSELACFPSALTSLLSLLHPSSAPGTDEDIRAVAALVLGSSLQNNPTALSHALSGDDKIPLMNKLLFALSANSETPKVQERVLYALSSVTRAPGQRRLFLAHDGLGHLKTEFRVQGTGSGDGRDGVRGRIGNFVVDYFVDEDMAVEGEEERVGDEVLEGWCGIFGEAVKRWGKDGEECGSAYEKVKSALEALDERLGGCKKESREL